MINENRMIVRQETGTLAVFAYVGNQASPVAGAKVTVKDITGNEIATTQTNESGQTEEIELETPEKNLSLTPSSVIPYSKYNVTIEADGYATADINGVQIFADTESIQPVELTPAQRINGRQPVEEYNISEHNLVFGEPKLSEKEINKQLPTKAIDTFKVLPTPVVPSQIIVHDGDPRSESRPKFTVDFKSYITNVACSEIYPTWPTEAIKANIICIISFTLNRVFTEFYRSKGKRFTITSHTGYDHKYIHKRNIHANVSRIVDSIFSDYLNIPGRKEPFLAQYCDGKKVKCPGWLTQWGSKFLADQGKNYLQILKHYYGPQIQIKRAKKVQGIPESFPGNNLKIGSKGEHVRTIQTFLNRISKNFPAIKSVTVNGVFGSETQAQVKKFQSVFRLQRSGIVDYATWYKISDIYVAVTKMAEGPAGGPRTFDSPYTTLKYFNQGNGYAPYIPANHLNQRNGYTPYITSNYLNQRYGYAPYIPAYHLNQRNGYTPYITWAPLWIPVLRYW
jgi:hypothetical protein